MKHALRRFAARELDGILPYTSYPITDEEYLGQYDGSLASTKRWLTESGYHYQLFAAVKYLDGETDDGSYARITQGHPVDALETGLDSLNPRECQYHVHLYERDECVELYGHYEIHPYPHIPEWNMDRPRRHYRPTKTGPREERTYLKGTVDPELIEDIQ